MTLSPTLTLDIYLSASIYPNPTQVDTFGAVNTDGTNEPWEYKDGWAYRTWSGQGYDGAAFQIAHWMFSGPDALKGAATNNAASSPMPMGLYGQYMSW